MKNEETIRKEFNKRFGETLKTLNLTAKIDETALAEIALLDSNAFLRARPPYIAVTGITHTGKSSLINALFGEKKTEEGLTADTTSVVVKIQFKSGMLIYDTPGGGGVEVELENITRAYLGLPQLAQDLYGNDLEPILELPTIDADNYDPVTDSPKAFKRHEEFEKPDVFIFVVDIKAGGLKRDDIVFFRAVASLGRPVIVVVNKIDGVDDNAVQASLARIKKHLSRQAIPVSAKTGQNIKELVTQIIKNLPPNCSQVLGETVNREYRKLVRYQTINIYSIATAVKTARLVGVRGNTDDFYQIVANVLGLYLWILDQYSLSEKHLEIAGITFSDLSNLVESKPNSTEVWNVGSGKSTLILGSAALGLAIGSIASAGLVIPIGIGASVGWCLPSGILILKESLKCLRISKLESESEIIKQFISTANRYNTAASILAFGQSIRKSCDNLENQEISKVNFSQLFQQESERISEALNPFAKDLNQVKPHNEDSLIRTIFSNILL